MGVAWTWVKRTLTSPETLARVLGRYDWPEPNWSPYNNVPPPSVEAVAGVVAQVRVTEAVEIRRRLLRRHWWQLWALIDAREAELPALYEAVRRHEWGPYSRREWRQAHGHVLQSSPVTLTVDDVARLILDTKCTDATRLMALRGWGTRLREVVKERDSRFI